MSKVDAMRALREARRAAGPQAPSRAAAVAAAPRRTVATPVPSASATAGDEPDTGSCGHRSMNGRSCTRDAGHAEKNHRYG